MRNLRFKRKYKSADGSDGKRRKNDVAPLQFKATVKTETSIKSRVSILYVKIHA